MFGELLLIKIENYKPIQKEVMLLWIILSSNLPYISVWL